MAEVLIVYATVEGHSRKIAEHLCDHVVRLCRGARVVDAVRLPADLDLNRFAAAIVVAPVHMGRHHQAIAHFARENAAWLQGRPSALVSVSLHAVELEPGDLEECREYVDQFAAETGWIPQETHYAAGALKFTSYDFFKRWAMRRIVAEKGLSQERAKGGDIEFTDWRALEAFVEQFLNRNAPAGQPAGA